MSYADHLVDQITDGLLRGPRGQHRRRNRKRSKRVDILIDETEVAQGVRVGTDFHLDGGRVVPQERVEPLITPKAAAAELNASVGQVYSWLRAGILAGVQISNYFWLVRRRAMYAFVPPRRGRPAKQV